MKPTSLARKWRKGSRNFSGGDRNRGAPLYRSTHDAIEQLVICLSHEIRHQWLMEHMPMDREVLKQWLKAGYVAETKEILEQTVKPVIQKILAERGLRLSEEKTVITHIRDGFDFLGKTVRKFGTQLIVQPSKAAAKSLREKLGVL